MACPFECWEQLSIIGRPLLLVWFQLGAVKCQRFPSIRSSLLQYTADGDVRRVHSEGELGTRARMEAAARADLVASKEAWHSGVQLSVFGFEAFGPLRASNRWNRCRAAFGINRR